MKKYNKPEMRVFHLSTPMIMAGSIGEVKGDDWTGGLPLKSKGIDDLDFSAGSSSLLDGASDNGFVDFE